MKRNKERITRRRKKPRISHFSGFGSKGPKMGLKQGPEGSERWVSWAFGAQLDEV